MNELLENVQLDVDAMNNEPGDSCEFSRATDPLIIMVFGATGDLTKRKLFPSLYRLYLSDGIPEPFCIIGVGRSALTDEEFREHMRESAEAMAEHDPKAWEKLAGQLHYQSVDFKSDASFTELASTVNRLDAQYKIGGNLLMYCALPPTMYPIVAERVGKAGLAEENTNGRGWSRLVVEKPFGRDLPSARELDSVLHRWFNEEQIYRIDHYLAKETVQNIILFRFANTIFEPVWNRRYIESVSITAAESLGVEHRAAYYEEAGVLRDMFQNHMMQLLALCAMEPPSCYRAEPVRDEKSKVYRALRPFPTDRIDDYLVLGQYGAGTIDGKEVQDYRSEPGVAADSVTPTYACMKVFVDNWRWQGVPFYLTSGKRLASKHTEIIVQFKPVPVSMFRSVLGEHITPNQLVIGIQPQEEVKLTFQAKLPGAKMCLRSVTMNFNYGDGEKGMELDAYEKVLLDCMLGDQTLFWRQDSVELCWGFLTPIVEECDCHDREKSLHFYAAGKNGPDELKRLFP